MEEILGKKYMGGVGYSLAMYVFNNPTSS